MIIYVVVHGFDYEGIASLYEAFYTEDEAQQCVNNIGRIGRGEFYEIEEVDLNEKNRS